MLELPPRSLKQLNKFESVVPDYNVGKNSVPFPNLCHPMSHTKSWL